MNEIARGINARRNEFDAIVNDFRAVWAKVYRDELKAEYDAIVNEIRAAKENGLNKDEMKQLNDKRYALEQIQAKVKSLNLSADERELVRTMHDDGRNCFEIRPLTERGAERMEEGEEICVGNHWHTGKYPEYLF